MKGHIRLDMSEVIEEFSMSKKTGEKLCKTILSAVSQEIANNWRKAASQSLKSTRSDYIRGIVVIEEGRLTNSIVLKGEFNNKLESGAPPYDMKQYFMKSKKVKHNKKGQWYLNIPFRLGAEGSLGENAAFSSVMPKEVYDVAKDLKPTKTFLGFKVSSGSGMTKDQIPAKFREVITRKDRDGFGDYTHKHSIYEGMIRTEKINVTGGRSSQYTVIRTASANSDPSSWIHPGFKALNLADKAQTMTDLDVLVNNITDKFIANM